MHGRLFAALVYDPQLVLRRLVGLGIGTNSFIQTGWVNSPHRLRTVVCRMHHPGLLGMGQIGPNGHGPTAGVIDLVRAQDFERVFGPSFDQSRYFLQLNTSSHYRVLQNCVHSKPILARMMVVRLGFGAETAEFTGGFT
jgi:hypothetical protein